MKTQGVWRPRSRTRTRWPGEGERCAGEGEGDRAHRSRSWGVAPKAGRRPERTRPADGLPRHRGTGDAPMLSVLYTSP